MGTYNVCIFFCCCSFCCFVLSNVIAIVLSSCTFSLFICLQHFAVNVGDSGALGGGDGGGIICKCFKGIISVSLLSKDKTQQSHH